MVQRQLHASGNNRVPERDDSDAVLGARVRAARMSQGKTLEEVAQSANVTRSFLSQVERGVASPSLTTLRRIAAGTRVNLEVDMLARYVERMLGDRGG